MFVSHFFYINLHRALIYDTYEEQATIEYSDGKITLESQWFPDFDKLTLFENSTTAYKDETEISIDRIIVKDGIAYVNCKFFEDVFGWTLDEISHDVISDSYNIGYYTNTEY